MSAMRKTLPPLAAALVAATLPLVVRADDKPEDPDDLASLEALAIKVETESFIPGDLKRLSEVFTVEYLKELPAPDGLKFPAKSSFKLEADFTRKYYEQYDAAFDALGRSARAIAKDNDLWK